jgi:glycosyltransferase involved in cell wall biosynthesis
MVGHRIAIVIPALNEARTIEAVVANARVHGLPVVVDDGSHDDTGARAAAAGAEVVRLPENRGYDGAIGAGFARAAEIGCRYLITMDADGQHDPGVVGAFIGALDSGADVVIGNRDRRQRFSEKLFAWAARLRWGVFDPLCGMKGYRVEVYRELGHFDSYGSIGTELALFAARNGRRVAQVPVKTRPRADAPRFGSTLRANLRILRAFCREMLRGRR